MNGSGFVTSSTGSVTLLGNTRDTAFLSTLIEGTVLLQEPIRVVYTWRNKIVFYFLQSS